MNPPAKQPIPIAVVGTGYFGSFHCGKMASIDGVRLAAVVDINQERARRTADEFGAEALCSHRELSGRVKAAVVAVPTSAHHVVAADLLAAGIELLVEKPLATTLADAEHLCRLAAGRTLRLQVGHLERFNPVFLEASKRIHKPRYIRMERCGPFPGRGGDVDIVHELMTHDLDILLQLTPAAVSGVSASGWSVITPHVDVATAQVRFEDGLVADLMSSRVSPERIRRFLVLDEQGTLHVDLAGGWIRRNLLDGGRVGSEKLRLDGGDPLLDQDRSFAEILRNGQQPRVGGEAGKATVALAARILDCIRAGGGC
jgi:predicted dehydrogenase